MVASAGSLEIALCADVARLQDDLHLAAEVQLDRLDSQLAASQPTTDLLDEAVKLLAEGKAIGALMHDEWITISTARAHAPMVMTVEPLSAPPLTEDDIPLRLSMDDPTTDRELAARLEVLLNGTPRTEVIGYDIKARTITRYATDERGHIITDGDEAKRETLTGDVAVRLKPA